MQNIFSLRSVLKPQGPFFMNNVMSNITLLYCIAICFLLHLSGHIYIEANRIHIFFTLLFKDFLCQHYWPFNMFFYLLFLKKNLIIL